MSHGRSLVCRVGRWAAVVAALLLCLWRPWAPAAAQTVVRASLDRSRITTDDRVSLTVVVSAVPDRDPLLPLLDGFLVVNVGVLQTANTVGGQTRTETVYQYTLQPTRAGQARIDPIAVLVGGQTYYTEPLTLTVEAGTAPPPVLTLPLGPPAGLGGQDFYAEALIDNPTPYLGEQVLYRVRLYFAAPLSNTPQYEPPPFVGFWQPQLTQQLAGELQHAGRRYAVAELLTPLFPAVGGPRAIAPAQLTINRELVLQTAELPVSVRPLPQPQPAGFSGATGRFALTAELDRAEVAVGEPVTLRVTLRGAGNLETTADPVWTAPEGWRQFERRSRLQTRFENGVLSGERISERQLFPGRAGEYALPPATFLYFDPQIEQYVEARSDALQLTVREAPADSAGEQPPAAPTADPLRPPKPAPDRLTPSPALWPGGWGFWLLCAGPLAWLLWDGRHALPRRPARAPRRADPYQIAQDALREARRSESTADQAARVEQIVNAYLEARLARPLRHLTQRTRARELAALGLSNALIERLNAFSVTCERLRFQPHDPAEAAELPDAAEALLAQLERGMP